MLDNNYNNQNNNDSNDFNYNIDDNDDDNDDHDIFNKEAPFRGPYNPFIEPLGGGGQVLGDAIITLCV